MLSSASGSLLLLLSPVWAANGGADREANAAAANPGPKSEARAHQTSSGRRRVLAAAATRRRLPLWAPLLLLISGWLALPAASGQVIRLRHPESSGDQVQHVEGGPQQPVHNPNHNHRHHHHHRRPLDPAIRHQARPGNVIVHFDRNHEISRLQYVLRDGRLASVYQRPHGHQGRGRNHGGPQAAANLETHSRMAAELPAALVAQPPPPPTQEAGDGEPVLVGHWSELRADELAAKGVADADQAGKWALGRPAGHEHTIGILDDGLKAMGQLVGDRHVTLELQAGGEDKLRVLGTIAQDALHEGVQLGELKLKRKLEAMKHKLVGKLKQLPHLIGTKLQSKSSAGKLFLDRAAAATATGDEAAAAVKLGQPDGTTTTQQLQQRPYVQSMPSQQQQQQLLVLAARDQLQLDPSGQQPVASVV